jgi:hypothetical protein
MINVWTKITSEKFDVMIKTGINLEPKGWTWRCVQILGAMASVESTWYESSGQVRCLNFNVKN